jgi:hypothetical protein
VNELVQQHLGLTDYHLKAQAHQFRGFLQGLQEVRQGVQGARQKSGR